MRDMTRKLLLGFNLFKFYIYVKAPIPGPGMGYIIKVEI